MSTRTTGTSGGKLEVDIVASRDLVRGFQRRLRGIVHVPASELAIDVLDDPSASSHLLHQKVFNFVPTATSGGTSEEQELERALQEAEFKHSIVEQRIQQEQRRGKQHLSAYEKRKRNIISSSSPTASNNNNNSSSFLFVGGSSSQSPSSKPTAGTSSSPPKTLKESLNEAIKLDEEANATYNQKKQIYQQLMDRRRSHQHQHRQRSGSVVSVSGTTAKSVANSSFGISRASSNMSSVWARRSNLIQSKKEQAEERVKEAYQEHRSELKHADKKTRLSKAVFKSKEEVLPLVLERECNSRMRHLGSSRCYYYDSVNQHQDGSPLREEGFDYCDLSESQEERENSKLDDFLDGGGASSLGRQSSTVTARTASDARRATGKPLDFNTIMSDPKLIRQRLNSGEFGPMMKPIETNDDGETSTRKSSPVLRGRDFSGDEDEYQNSITLPSAIQSRGSNNLKRRKSQASFSIPNTSFALSSRANNASFQQQPGSGSGSGSVNNASFGMMSASGQNNNNASFTRQSTTSSSQHHHRNAFSPSSYTLYGDGEGGKIIGLDPHREKPVKLSKQPDTRPSWTMKTPTSPVAVEQLLRRQHAVTPPRPGHCIAAPFEEKRRYFQDSNVPGMDFAATKRRATTPTLSKTTSKKQFSFADSTTSNQPQWEICYAVQ